jgi:mono/diheme cytochrome c family protein
MCGVFTLALAATPSFAADAGHGRTVALRWCASCHLVERDQRSASDQAPSFATIARMPDFSATKLAFLLLIPHPNMPNLALSRTEVADIADYIAELK